MEVDVRPADQSEVRFTAQGPRALCCAAAAAVPVSTRPDSGGVRRRVGRHERVAVGSLDAGQPTSARMSFGLSTPPRQTRLPAGPLRPRIEGDSEASGLRQERPQ
jgi:hypothetical protein